MGNKNTRLLGRIQKANRFSIDFIEFTQNLAETILYFFFGFVYIKYINSLLICNFPSF